MQIQHKTKRTVELTAGLSSPLFDLFGEIRCTQGPPL